MAQLLLCCLSPVAVLRLRFSLLILLVCDRPPVLARSVLQNNLSEVGANAIVQAAQNNSRLTTLCGIKPDQTVADFKYHGLNMGDAILLAFDLSRNSGLVKLECARL